MRIFSVSNFGNGFSISLSVCLAEDDKKVLCQLLGKLHLPEKVDEDKLRTLKLLMHNLRSVRLDTSATCHQSMSLISPPRSVVPSAIPLPITHLHVSIRP